MIDLFIDGKRVKSSSGKTREIIQNKPKDRNELVKIKRGSLADLNLQFGNVRNKRKNKNSGIF